MRFRVHIQRNVYPKTQGHFLHGCIATMSNDEPLVLENSVELSVKCLDDEKKRDNSDWDDKQ